MLLIQKVLVLFFTLPTDAPTNLPIIKINMKGKVALLIDHPCEEYIKLGNTTILA
jgi:hypothetical protein